ncbi:hypothetical protein SPI_08515 [Niveomyces insectorum RCEF 264]|uniref:DUF7492 domain-containing protein n=1 Tax=Niveomyces insectorum RCEF 264 TaxID=1081102 RepID=A0A167N1B1_9HYPO|nr:hypothetical protein SPI_08515 [Niveomyces insectorum RCEF 264]
MGHFYKALFGVAVVLGYLPFPGVESHSWGEQLMRIGVNGTMIGLPGYVRGYVPRTAPNFNDDMINYLVPPNDGRTVNAVLPTDRLCHPAQTIGNYTAAYPMLVVMPGDFVAIRYQENGHVTLPDINPAKPTNRGTVYIYGTAHPVENELFQTVFQNWTADGTGGDGRGRLIATRQFDDTQCYQINNGPISTTRQSQYKKVAQNPQGADLWCQNDIQLPMDLVKNTNYTLYWIWNWPTFNAPGAPTDIPTDGYTVQTVQHYTSCMDVAVVDDDGHDDANDGDGHSNGKGNNGAGPGGSAKTNNFAKSFVQGQDLNSAAVLAQLQGGAFQVDVPGCGGGDGNNSGGASAAPTAARVHTYTFTVTETLPPVYVTETVPAGGDDATATAVVQTPSPSPSPATNKKTSTSTTFITETVTRTAGSADASAPLADATTAPVLPAGQAPTVRPFLTARDGHDVASRSGKLPHRVRGGRRP